jgi:hypothetical protein
MEPPDASDTGDASDTSDAGDDATADAGDSDAAAGDAGSAERDDSGATTPDAGDSSQAPPSYPSPNAGACPYLDDFDRAFVGMHLQDVWVTRLRAALPSNALAAGDLLLEPSNAQIPINNVYYAPAYLDEDQSKGASVNGGSGGGACVSAPKQRTAFGSWALAVGVAVAAVAWARRRTRR